jgi:NAD(P)-dependent dehydrogenase (short-subunit alcohol dehydrogenase family)
MREGADVGIVHMKAEQRNADETQCAIEAEGGRCLCIPGGVRTSAFCDRAVQRVVDELGRLDILVNNAAFQQHQKRIEDLTDEQIERGLELHHRRSAHPAWRKHDG